MRITHLLLFMVFSFIGCDTSNETRITYRQQANPAEKQDVTNQLNALTEKVRILELFASTYTTGAPTAFGDCDSLISASEKKICQIAKSVSDANSLEVKASLAAAAKEFQSTLYGDSCTSVVEVGCPVSGSVLANITSVQASLATNAASISSIQSTITSMQSVATSLATRVTAIENRFNSFNGTAQSIEIIVTGIRSDITSLQTDVAELKGLISPSRIVNQFLLCGDNTVSGPLFEIILISGDKANAYGTVKNGTYYGTALFFKAGDTNLFTTTHLNTKACKFKMYNNVGNTKVQACWINSDRSATEAQIDAARTATTATCTPF